MAIMAMLNAIDDIFIMPVLRLFGVGRGRSKVKPYPFDPNNPGDLIAALNRGSTREAGIAQMRKLHYGAYYTNTRSRWGAAAAEKELRTMGKGFGGAAFGRPMKGISLAHSHIKANFGAIGVGLSALGTGYKVYNAPKHHKMSAFVGGVSEAVSFGIGDAIGTALAGPVVGLIAGGLTATIAGKVEEGLQFFNDFNRTVRHINMGGNYEDTIQAYTMRQRAAQELGSSVLNARQWLGKEAILMHQ